MIQSETRQHERQRAGTRWPAWLLVATLPAYVVFVVLSATVLRPQVESTSAELTPSQIADMGFAWVGLAVLWMVPPVMAAIALAAIAQRLPETTAAHRVVPYLSGAAVLMAAGNVFVNLLAVTVQTPTWGDSPLFTTGFVLSLLVGWAGVHPATLLVLVALFRMGVAKKTAAIVGVIYALYWVLELLVYVPLLVSQESLADADAGLPPFLLGFFWAVIGGVLVRTGVPSEP